MMNKENTNKNQAETVLIDIERMEKALNSESFTMPENLTREEKIAFICSKAKKEN